MSSHVTTTVRPLFGRPLSFARCTTCGKETSVHLRGRLPHCPDVSCDGRLVRQRFRIVDPKPTPVYFVHETGIYALDGSGAPVLISTPVPDGLFDPLDSSARVDPFDMPLPTLGEILARIGRKPRPASDFDDGGDDRE